MEKHKQPVNYIQSISNLVKEIWKPVLLILFGMFINFFLVIIGPIYFSVADLVNPVVRIETILQTDFPDEKILATSYSRAVIFEEEEGDSFEFTLAMNQSEFDDFCDGSYEWAKEHQYTNFQAHCSVWDFEHLQAYYIRVEKKDFDLYEVRIKGYLRPECNSTGMFTLDSPCF